MSGDKILWKRELKRHHEAKARKLELYPEGSGEPPKAVEQGKVLVRFVLWQDHSADGRGGKLLDGRLLPEASRLL